MPRQSWLVEIRSAARVLPRAKVGSKMAVQRVESW